MISANCLSLFDHFVKLVPKGLRKNLTKSQPEKFILFKTKLIGRDQKKGRIT